MTNIAPRDPATAGPGLPAAPHPFIPGQLSPGLLVPGLLVPGILILTLAAGACAPTVRVEAPKDPITINLNIQADVRVTLEEKAKEDIQANPGVF